MVLSKVGVDMVLLSLARMDVIPAGPEARML